MDFLNAPTPNRRTQLRHCLRCRPVPRAALADPQASRLRPSRFPAPAPTPLATAVPKPPTFTTHFLPSLCQTHKHRCHLGCHLSSRVIRVRRHLFRTFPSPTHSHRSGRGFSVRVRRHLFRTFPSPNRRHLSGRGFSVRVRHHLFRTFPSTLQGPRQFLLCRLVRPRPP